MRGDPSSSEGVPRADGAFDPRRRYGLDPDVALRDEPFGALAYHYRTRMLTFLRSPTLVQLVRQLGEHASVDAAVAASVEEPRRGAYMNALVSLAASQFIVSLEG